jgi:hypothetical protein
MGAMWIHEKKKMMIITTPSAYMYHAIKFNNLLEREILKGEGANKP